jgi:hypothetical protein
VFQNVSIDQNLHSNTDFPVKETDTGETKPEYGALPTFEQSAPARFEFRGGLEACRLCSQLV